MSKNANIDDFHMIILIQGPEGRKNPQRQILLPLGMIGMTHMKTAAKAGRCLSRYEMKRQKYS